MTIDELTAQYWKADADQTDAKTVIRDAKYAKADALYHLHTDHGLTMPELGERFYVTKQRIYALIALVRP